MIADIVASEKGHNKGSVRKLANYLEKENANKPSHEKEWFFSHEGDMISAEEVTHAIDNNRKGLKKNEAKFYMITLAPDKKELKYIQNDPEKLKAFTRRVMDDYAKNFDRSYSITGKDLMYFAKIEQERKYRGTDNAVKEGHAKQGDLKPGLQTHVHVIVAKKSLDGTKQFSPRINSKSMHKGGPVKSGFNRSAFATKVEQAFDEVTGYQRSLADTFEYRNTMKRGSAEDRLIMQERLAQERPLQPSLTPSKGLGKTTARGIKRAMQANQDINPQNSNNPTL